MTIAADQLSTIKELKARAIDYECRIKNLVDEVSLANGMYDAEKARAELYKRHIDELKTLLKNIGDWLGMDCEWSTPEQAECLLRNTIHEYYKRIRAAERADLEGE